MNHLPYKLLLLDVDGTVASSRGDSLPTKRVIEAVQAAQQHLHVALATGRPLSYARPIIDAFGLHGPSVFEGGAEVIDVTDNKQLHRQYLAVDTLVELVRIALPFGYGVYTNDDDYDKGIHVPAEISKPSAKLFIQAVNTADMASMLGELRSVKGAAAHQATSWIAGDVFDIHITHEHATKRYGVEKLMDILGVSKDETIAIGDGHNDVPMLEAAGFKVAMGNAPDEVKALADFVAPSIDDDGVVDVIERFILA